MRVGVRLARYAMPGVIAALLCSPASAFAQDALSQAFDHCTDVSRQIDERIADCTLAAQAQGIGQDEKAFAYIDLGLAYDAKGDHDAALQALNQAAELQPDVWQTYYNRGRVQVERDNPDAALADYNRLLDIDPSKVPMFRSGITDYRTLHEGQTTDMSSSQREADAHSDAERELKAMVANGFAFRCQQREMAGGTRDGALSDCDKALSMTPGDAKMLELRGIIHMQRKELAAGHADFDAAVKADPKSADALYLRGLSEEVAGDMPASKADISAAMTIDPNVARRFTPKAATP